MIKQVTEIPTDQLQEILHKLDQLTEFVESSKKDERDNWLTLQEFADRIQLGLTQIYVMMRGDHPSGFRLKTHKWPKSQKVWVPKSELTRYFSFDANNHE